MLSESLVEAVSLQACPFLANSPQAEWCRTHWEGNFRSIQFWARVQTQSTNHLPIESSRDRVVLVVDDEIAIAITLSQILVRHGFPTIWLTDPCSAAALFEKLPLRLLITDIDMPGIDGVTLAALARHNHANCPVLLFSARGAECRTAERLSVCDDGIHIQTKPVAVDALLNRVRTLCTSPRDISPAPKPYRDQELQHSL